MPFEDLCPQISWRGSTTFTPPVWGVPHAVVASWPGQNSLRVGGLIKFLSRERYCCQRGEGLSRKLAGTAANFLLGSNKSCCRA